MSDKLFPGERLYPLLSELQPGDAVVWHLRQRGGYGFTSKLAAKVVRVGAKKVTIEAQARHGSFTTSVFPESLRKAQT